MSVKRVAVLLSGCGVYDGAEIHEAVFTLYALEKFNLKPVLFAPDREQHHVVNHLNGEETKEKRNILVEAARIARGEISPLDKCDASSLDALVVTGGFGAAKNLSRWAFDGPTGEIYPDVKSVILQFVNAKKAIVALCMAPVLIAKACEGTSVHPLLTVGTTSEATPYDISAIHQGMSSIGSKVESKSVREICVDRTNRIISAPCYMMEAGPLAVCENICMAVGELQKLI